MIKLILLVQILVLSIIPGLVSAQEQPFSLDACINYAWENSTEISRANNSVGIQNAYLTQSKADRSPNLFMRANQILNTSSSYEDNSGIGSWKTNSNSILSVSLNSEITLYNGAILKNTITQNRIKLAAYEIDIQTQKELISLNILSAYINALLVIENINNFELQVQSTKKQFDLAQARKSAGTISTSDFLNIKSQYASDKASLINTRNTLKINYVALMQLMNMPFSDSFSIQEPDVNALLKIEHGFDANSVYMSALNIQPVIQSAKLSLESAQIGVKIAKAGALPELSLSGSLGTGYNSDMTDCNFNEQFSNKINPSIGLSLSIPIFQRKKVKTDVSIAKIKYQNEELSLVDLKNDLRKYIEHACIDAKIASSNFLALQEQYDAENEAYQLSYEMFSQGMINSVDFLTSKNNLVKAENKLTQAKYNVLLQNKIIDYYLGNPILF